ncbi:hypothetical protein GR212_33250 [Rhizobium lusitanum]|uniref:Uncharacterized protein n=1 Tax=Rhizobium lusitanum TaxID=293958 RepID=A0A6L9UGG9_9HYPH|nr:hypothetical protein [Rhizobium lusitanum]NEI74421.1 hypothetical protein [Rhizobium lusitanum]
MVEREDDANLQEEKGGLPFAAGGRRKGDAVRERLDIAECQMCERM